MSEDQAFQFRFLEGHRVCLALGNGGRVDDCQLVSIGRYGLNSLWIDIDGSDCFVDLHEVVEIWESRITGRAA